MFDNLTETPVVPIITADSVTFYFDEAAAKGKGGTFTAHLTNGEKVEYTTMSIKPDAESGIKRVSGDDIVHIRYPRQGNSLIRSL